MRPGERPQPARGIPAWGKQSGPAGMERRRPARGAADQVQPGQGAAGLARRPGEEAQPGRWREAQPGREYAGPAGLAAYSGLACQVPAQPHYNLAWAWLIRPRLLLACFFNSPAYIT
jgi:hypothetical protein